MTQRLKTGRDRDRMFGDRMLYWESGEHLSVDGGKS